MEGAEPEPTEAEAFTLDDDFADAFEEALAGAFDDQPAGEEAAPAQEQDAEEDDGQHAPQDEMDAEAPDAHEAQELAASQQPSHGGHDGFMDEDDYDETLGAEAPASQQQDRAGGTSNSQSRPEASARGAPSAPRPAPAPLSFSDKDAHRRRVLGVLSEEQLNRYECYRRCSLARPKMKKLLSTLVGTNSFNDKLVIAMCGITKIFVGDLVETARQLASEEGHAGPLLPRHIRRAYGVLGKNGDVPRKQPPRRMFC